MIRQLLYGGVMALVCMAQLTEAQTATYNNHAQLSTRLKNLSSKYAAQASVRSIGKSSGGRDLWLLTLGKGDATKKPAILVVAGLDGTHLAGTELAIQTAEKMLGAANADSISKLLDAKTFYFLPSMNPDAQEQFSAKLKYERTGNDTKADDDRDGRMDEDPFEDLNGDGLVTWVRVEDLAGTFVASKEDPRILVKADPTKGESGKYLIFSEGTDNDKDNAFNEDGAGGINPEKNFTFDYQIFVTGGGEYAASEPEVRALLDFLYRAPNIFAVLTFGPNNNLSEAPRFDASKVARRILTGPLSKDAKAMDQVSKLYNGRTGLKDAPSMPQTRANFSQTAYYHAGRYSFTTPGWWAPKAEAPRDSTRRAAAAPTTPPNTTAPAGPPAGGGGGGRFGGGAGGGGAAAAAAANAAGASEDDTRFLKWADKEKLTGVFVDWKTIQHPDFPNQKAEVGGMVPFAKLNPPVSYLAASADKHLKFLTGLGAQMPEVQLVNVKSESLGNGLTRVTATVINKGLLPTYAEIGDRVRYVQKVKTELKLGAGQAIVSGRRLNLRGALAPDESEEYTWLVSGTGKLTIEAGCPTAGVKSASVTLAP